MKEIPTIMENHIREAIRNLQDNKGAVIKGICPRKQKGLCPSDEDLSNCHMCRYSQDTYDLIEQELTTRLETRVEREEVWKVGTELERKSHVEYFRTQREGALFVQQGYEYGNYFILCKPLSFAPPQIPKEHTDWEKEFFGKE